jgi:3-hydroxy acid dehydrogenase/malonic semialdehyde reductase
LNPLKDRIVLVTGASAGIGEAVAVAFAEQGARLILAARRVERLKTLAASLKDRFDTPSYLLRLDVTQASDVAQAIASLPKEWKNMDVLVNNAGLGRGLDKLHEGQIKDWEEMIDTNIKGLLYVSRAVIPGMVERRSGHIINMGSAAGHEVYPGGNVYCATKYAVAALTKGMQLELVDTPIRVTTIDPGLVETEFSLIRFHGDTERAKKPYENIQPLTGRDIAEIVVFAATRPAHVNINEVIVMATHQASTMVIHREKSS